MNRSQLNIDNTTVEERSKMFDSYARKNYRKIPLRLNKDLGINIFEITDFEELKTIRDNIAKTQKVSENRKDPRGTYSTTIQTYIRMLYAIWLYGKDNIKAYNPETQWRQLIRDLKNSNLIKDDDYIPSSPSIYQIKSPKEEDPSSKDNKNELADESHYSNDFSINLLIDAIRATGLIYEDLLIKRYVASLFTKPFVILSGLAGSGKTQLSIALAHALSECVEEQVRIVAVGADWTNREPLLGYPNALKENVYVKPENGVLDLIISAAKNPEKPYFLILDEMNLSYVERYFADFLSAMESRKAISLWVGDGVEVPQSVNLPRNLFITGTINVDETTYMFSPKVLDRANVIEFKIQEDEMSTFLQKLSSIDINSVNGKVVGIAKSFLHKSYSKEMIMDENLNDVLLGFFRELKKVNAEFGYRTASEIFRFIKHAENLGVEITSAIDCAIVQKLLPKLHGSKKHIENTLKALWSICLKLPNSEPLNLNSIANKDNCRYPLSADKILRMYQAACNNGFTSFAEA